jgi:hypothetical protein
MRRIGAFQTANYRPNGNDAGSTSAALHFDQLRIPLMRFPTLVEYPLRAGAVFLEACYLRIETENPIELVPIQTGLRF